MDTNASFLLLLPSHKEGGDACFFFSFFLPYLPNRRAGWRAFEGYKIITGFALIERVLSRKNFKKNVYYTNETRELFPISHILFCYLLVLLSEREEPYKVLGVHHGVFGGRKELKKIKK